MKSLYAAIGMTVVIVIYLVVVVQRAVILLTSGEVLGVIMGAALLVFPLIAVWAIVRELMFGVRTQKLGRILESEGALPDDEIATRASGRPIRAEADAVFPRYQAEVEAEPASWRSWFRLGLAYDASGDRRRARRALREAIRLYRINAQASA